MHGNVYVFCDVFSVCVETSEWPTHCNYNARSYTFVMLLYDVFVVCSLKGTLQANHNLITLVTSTTRVVLRPTYDMSPHLKRAHCTPPGPSLYRVLCTQWGLQQWNVFMMILSQSACKPQLNMNCMRNVLGLLRLGWLNLA